MNSKFSFLRYLKPANIHDKLFYDKWYNFIEKSQWWSKDELNNYQWQKVKELIEHSYNTVSYYRELFDSIGAKPEDFKTWDDFTKIPFLTKEIVRERAVNLISSNTKNNNKLQYYTTGGSTGQPLGFYRQPIMDTIERAFMFHQWGRVGFTENSKRVILRGEPVKDGNLFQKHRFNNVWLMSSYHLSPDYINEYINELNKIKPEFFHVYPTSFYIFTQLLLQSNKKLDFQIKAILCGSESVYDYQRSFFEQTYNTRVYSWLGQAEGAVLAGECEQTNYYHIWPQHSYVELLDGYRNPITERGISGEIIGTTINNFGSPFIRYKTGDIGTYYDDHCHDCGRNYMIISKIDGRNQDKLILVDGRQIPLTAITFGQHFEAYRKINKMQIVQKSAGEIIIYIHPLSNIYFNLDDEKEISTKMIDAVGGKLSIDFVYTENLRRTKSGKHIYFIQEIKTS